MAGIMSAFPVFVLLFTAFVEGSPDISDKFLIQNTEDSYDDLPVAVSVARTTPHSGYIDKLQFPDIVVDIGNGWNAATNEIMVKNESVYFFHLSAGIEANQRCNMDLEGPLHKADILRFDTTHDGLDTIGKAFISKVSEPNNIYIQNNDGSELFSEGGRHTSLVAFDLEKYTKGDPKVIFSAGRTTALSAVGKITFSEPHVNIGNGFTSNQFEAQTAGFHFFSVSVGMQKGTSVGVSIKKAGTLIGAMHRLTNTTEGVDSMSMSLIANLAVQDVVTAHLDFGQLYSDTENQISFSGFRYVPYNGTAAAWSVYTVDEYLGDGNDTTVLDPLPFPETPLVNTEGIFNATDNRVYITQSGLYYVHLSIGADAFSTVDASVIRGRQRVEFNIYRSSLNHNGVDTLSHGLLLKLSDGDTLRVVLGPDSQMYSDANRLTSFSGFMVTALV